ncbi:MAG: ComEC family competence protein [Bacteroidales bacterium]|nr:ComEC family competence protein [Bacteroidales bacterium]
MRLFAALALGVALHDAVGQVRMELPWLFGLLAACIGLLLLLQSLLKSYRVQWVYGVATIIVFVYLGFFRACLQEVNGKRSCDGLMTEGEGYWLARVYDPPTEKDKTVKVLLELCGYASDIAVIKVSGKVMAYVEKNDEALALKYGDLLGFSALIEEVPPPLNPEEFDYRQYLDRRGVTGRVYLKQDEWFATGVSETNPLYEFAYRFRDQLLEALRRCGVTEDEFGVGAAILLGYDESLPAQIRQNYVAAGSMHILCVSGMHVGIIYLLASFLLGFIGKSKRIAAIRRLILLVLIWFYALLTGLSPSIMRSALMISFVICGEFFRRKGFALNSIAASAFVVLMIDPNNLFAIGFQLSYAAVVGIVLLQRPIYNLLYVSNKVLDKVWEITAVSLAAQIATMPFTVYYFHQFTPYFWLSNLFMTPLSFLAILLGMLLLMVSWVPLLNGVMGKVVWGVLYVMNALVAWIEQLPLSLVKGLYMTDFQFAVSILLLLLLLLFVNLKKKRMVMEMLVVSLIFVCTMAWRGWRLSRQKQFVVYSLRNHTAINIVNGFTNVLLCDEGLLADASTIDYSLKGHWARDQLSMNPTCYTLGEDFSNDLVFKQKNLVSAQGVLLALWDPALALDGEGHGIKVDYLMVCEKQKPDIQHVVNTYQVGTLLIDGSVPDYLREEWVRQAEVFGIPYDEVKKGSIDLILKQ